MQTKTLEAIEVICDRLVDRTATLFLGAGINHGITNSNGENFPLGSELGKTIASKMLGMPDCELALSEVAEIARHRVGEKEFNTFLHTIFESFTCSCTHISLLNLPWDCIFTTNYDTLIEKAQSVSKTAFHRQIQPIFSNSADLSTYSEDVLLLYKLHGCIDYANSYDGRLIITQSDYRFYESHRRKLFLRLERDLQSRCFVFVGYALRDNNFLAILSDACEALDIKSLPRSYAIRPNFTETEADYWLDRYNIQLVDATAEEFISALEQSWQSQERIILSPQERFSKNLQFVDQSTSLPLFTNAFHQLKLGQITGKSEPKRFFCGGEPSWPDIRDEIAPKRKGYWRLMEAIFPEISEPSLPVSTYLVTGPAGTGKTTLIKSICYDLLKDFDHDLPLLLHIPGVPIKANDLVALNSTTNPKRIVISFGEAAMDYDLIESFRADAVRLRLPVTIILEERKNQWLSGRSHRHQKLSPVEFELGGLSDDEIEDILDALAKHDGCLGSLTHKSREQQSSHFKNLAQKDLLVALRELTSNSSFDDIVKDEFNKIPTSEGRQAYLYAAAFGQIDLSLRYETLQHLLQINYSDFSPRVFNPTEGILLTGIPSGYSRHNFGFRIRVRHPIIASIIFAEGAPDDESKFIIINQVLARLDPGYNEDRRVLHAVVRRKELVGTFVDPEKRRALFARLAGILPNDPFVLQHRSILERDLGNGNAAVRFARQALKCEPHNMAFKNTLGFALEYASRSASGVVSDGFNREAEGLFMEGIKSNRREPFGYLGIASLKKQRIMEEMDFGRATILKAELLAFLEEAYEVTDESNLIATHLASIRSSLGNKDDAILAIKKGLAVNPTDTRLRSIWIEIEVELCRFEQAKRIAMEGIQHDPTSWRLHRHLARLQRIDSNSIHAISASYNAAIRHHKGDCSLLVEFAAYLFMSGSYSDAADVFKQAYQSAYTSEELRFIRERWKIGGKDHKFVGKVISTSGASGLLIAIPENFEVFFWRTRDEVSLLQVGDSVAFTVGFNCRGAIAHVIRNVARS